MKTIDSPKLLKGQFEGFPIGFVANGSYYYGVPTRTSDVLLASLDPESGDLTGQGEIVSPRFVGATRMCDWSVEGENLAYAAETKASLDGDRCWVFVIYSVETGQERIVVPSPKFHPLHRWGAIRLSPNGDSLLVRGDGFNEGEGLYKVDIETGAATRVVSTGGSNKSHRAVWSADGKSIYMCSEEAIVHHDLTSSEETQLYRGNLEPVSIDISPDGRWLAFFQGYHSLVVMPSAGGKPQQVVELGEDEIIGMMDARPFVRWTPDGEHLLFPRHANQLCKVNVQTGQQQQIGPKIDRLTDAAIQPGGQQIALTVLKEGSQLWVMENFLSD